MHKKASLNMAIEVIVIVVIAMTLLGLGLGFVRNQFSTITETTVTVQEQIKNQILDDLRIGNKKLSFPQTSLSIETGKFKDVAIGVKNQKQSGQLDFRIAFSVESMQGEPDKKNLQEQIDFFYSEGPFTLNVAEAEVYPVRITADGDKGTYLVKVAVNEIIDEDNTETYAERTFFVNII